MYWILHQRSRRSFIRLIALVKWAHSVSKINKCTEILDFLDQQSYYFTDTAVSEKWVDKKMYKCHIYKLQQPERKVVELETSQTFNIS
jgi:hypothetical protein